MSKIRKKKIHETKHWLRERKFPPSECRKGTFRTIKRGEHEFVICKKHGETSTSAQSELHPKKEKGKLRGRGFGYD